MKQKRLPLVVLAVLIAIAAFWSFMSLAAPRTETLDQQARDVALQLRCLVCQGESVADSPATLSQQMRSIIRVQLQSGKTKQQVVQYFVSRYGDRILEAPPWQGFSLIAWFVPILMFLGSALLLFFILRNWNTSSRSLPIQDDSELADIDQAELERYRSQLEQELAAGDPLFAQPGTE